MKTLFIDCLSSLNDGDEIVLCGWISGIRKHKTVIFYDFVDSTGTIQLVLSEKIEMVQIQIGDSVAVNGVIRVNKKNIEVLVKCIKRVGCNSLNLSPHPRSDFDIFSNKYNELMNENRHLYLCNSKMIATMKIRDLVMEAIRAWFKKERYIEVTAPILTPVLLYTKDTGIKTDIDSTNDIYLTQCVGFYLEAAVHALERVYNLGPSFRAAESHSNRHLNEYWHVKSELAWCCFDDFFAITESFLKYITEYVKDEGGAYAKIIGREMCLHALNGFQRIEYEAAIKLLNDNGIKIDYGKSLTSKAEKFISDYYHSPVWITHNPKEIEGFPYMFKSADNQHLTLTADLIASNGHGELLGIAEKITDIKDLEIRLTEKGKSEDDSYNWLKELRLSGTVPHCGMGMGLERLIKWLFNLNHVQDAIAFPRNIGRKIYP